MKEEHKELLQFIKSFSGRLDDDAVEFSADYINYGEYLLAIDTLCDYLVQYNTPLSEKDFENIMRFAGVCGGDTKDVRYLDLEDQITSEDKGG